MLMLPTLETLPTLRQVSIMSRDYLNERSIKINKVRCLFCNTVIESVHRHDFKWCACEAVAVDGGCEYLKRVWTGDNPEECYEELSEFNEREMVDE